MGKPTGFMEYDRQNYSYRKVADRLKDYKEMTLPLSPEQIKEQAARCMDCGVPFCHGEGCPLGNLIPETNELIYNDRWEEACANLHSTNNFPEYTGRLCPAPCEKACTVGIHDKPVNICHIEYQIVERGWKEGWVKPLIAKVKTGKKIAVVGSGPAGMATAQQLARNGHTVILFEKNEKIGGLLRYGIPDFKMEKNVIDRRLEQMTAEGVEFETGVNVGVDITANYLKKQFDVVCLTTGAEVPRGPNVPGDDLDGVHFALEFLTQQNRLNSKEDSDPAKPISAKGKSIVVIGGGDTGSDCVGTSNRQGAKEVSQFEILPKPPEERPESTPWPLWPASLRTSTSHDEGCTRRWNILTKELVEKDGKVTALKGVEVDWNKDENGRWVMSEKAGTEFEVKADLVLIAMGFVHPVHEGLVNDFGLELDGRGNVKTTNGMTSLDGVFAAGDTVSGASLIVRAINAGRETAESINEYLKK